ncbi:MAG: hypothetical protein KA207_02850 [Burkholderiaceae bacterium]|jgi:hypothetical protein|nr:hypothetical protein [Burkholderiaceae bacterium]
MAKTTNKPQGSKPQSQPATQPTMPSPTSDAQAPIRTIEQENQDPAMLAAKREMAEAFGFVY